MPPTRHRPPEVIAFRRKYQVSFLVVDDRHFTPEFLAGGRFFVPLDRQATKYSGHTLADRVELSLLCAFDPQIARLTRGRHQFALLSSKVFAATQLDEHLRLLDMRPWLTGNPAADLRNKLLIGCIRDEASRAIRYLITCTRGEDVFRLRDLINRRLTRTRYPRVGLRLATAGFSRDWRGRIRK